MRDFFLAHGVNFMLFTRADGAPTQGNVQGWPNAPNSAAKKPVDHSLLYPKVQQV